MEPLQPFELLGFTAKGRSVARAQQKTVELAR
jgi:hypothetical protein